MSLSRQCYVGARKLPAEVGRREAEGSSASTGCQKHEKMSMKLGEIGALRAMQRGVHISTALGASNRQMDVDD